MKIRLMELQNTNSHDAWKKVTPEEKKMMVKALEEWHMAKVTGVRTQGLAEMGDVRQTLEEINQEVCGLNKSAIVALREWPFLSFKHFGHAVAPHHLQ